MLAFVYARHAMEMQKMTKRGIKESLTVASLGGKCFGLVQEDCDFFTL